MQQDKDEEVLVLASLLHDIGKVRVRHDNSKKHAEHGYDMLMEIARSSPNKDFMKRIADLVKYHHTKPENTGLADKDKELLRILKDADCKSAAHERDDRDMPVQKDGPYLDKMSTYISILEKEGKKHERQHYYVHSEKELLNGLNGQSVGFGYKELDREIIGQISTLDLTKFVESIGSINSVLRNIVSYIPSAFYYSNPNIPLYDHLKISGAIAMSIYRSEKSGNSKFMLIRTDMSGIQDYIFKYFRSEQADERGTRRIRGRSLRVSLTTRAIVQYIVDELNLYDLNVMWLNSDGALILAPYSQESERKLEDIRKNIGQYFIDHDRGLSCAIGWNCGDYKIIPSVKKDQQKESEQLDVEDSDFKSFLDGLMNKVNEVKRRSYYDQLKANPEEFFIGSEIDPCWSCGLNNKVGEDRCEECLKEEELGSYIVKKSESLIMKKEPLDQRETGIEFNFGNFMYSFSLREPGEKENSSRILYINKYPDRIKDFQIPWEIFLIGNYTPKRNDGSLLTINEMLKIDDESSTRKYFYLGIFKADIDNMGTLISNGFPNLTLPSYACFSRQITIFFTYFVNQIANKNDIYLIYSGGDDISALGPIDRVIEFSGNVNMEFKKWVENDEITFSAGIATTHAKFPLRRGIKLAELELKESKNNEVNMKTKDSITVFETTMNWEEFEYMTKFKKEMYENIKDEYESLGKSFLQKLIKMDESNPYKEMNLKGRDLNFPDHLVYYYLQRNWNGSDTEKMKFMKDVVKKEKYKFIRYPATYILLEERLKK